MTQKRLFGRIFNSSVVQNVEMGSGIQLRWGLVVSGGVREGNPHF